MNAADATPLADALTFDAQSYADEWGTTLEEAVSRLELQQAIGELQAALEENESGTFGGLWIQHGPEFRVVIRSTDGTSGIQPYVEGSPLADLLTVQPAAETLASLRQAQSAAMSVAADLGIPVESDIRIQDGHVELYVLDTDAFSAVLGRSGAQLPAVVQVVRVEKHSTEVAEIYAGLELDLSRFVDPCTSGFAVQDDSSGTLGILTAAHCAPDPSVDTISYNGTVLPIQASAYGGSRDVLWATVPGFTAQNLMYDGTQTRYVLGTKGRSQQTNGEYVCKYGVTTDYNCGYIDSKDFRRQKAGQSWSSTWILVDKPGEHLVRPGDSGGPWFSGNTAYGITVAEVGDKALYMAINYIDILDVSVLTH